MEFQGIRWQIIKKFSSGVLYLKGTGQCNKLKGKNSLVKDHGPGRLLEVFGPFCACRVHKKVIELPNKGSDNRKKAPLIIVSNK